MMPQMRAGASVGETRPELADPGSPGTSPTSTGRRLAQALLILLAFVLPFETPLFRAGPLQITTVELALYAMLAVWGAGMAADALRGQLAWRQAVERLRRDALARAAVTWAVVLFASAAVAPSDRGAALKFSLRSLSGVLAFFATRSLSGSRPVGGRVLLALALGGIASAMTGLADAWWPGSAPVWKLFHEGTFDALGLKRASGVFEYPTIGAMYWEACLPLVCAAPFLWARAGARVRGAFVAVLACAILLLAVLASGTRTSLAGAAVACALLAVLGRPLDAVVSQVAAGTLVVLLALSAVALRPGAAASPTGQRVRWWHDGHWFGAQYEVPAAPIAVSGGAVFGVPITLRNTGVIAWKAAGALPTHLSYHLAVELADGEPPRLVEYEGVRTDLPEDVPPGGVVQVVGIVKAPEAAGTYRLSWDLVQENVTWFSDRGIAVAEQSIDVRSMDDAIPPEVFVPKPAIPPAPRARLWYAAISLWRERPLLGVGPDNFRRRYQAVLSPSPTGAPYTDTRIHANSLYFETLADVGLVGLVALGAIAVGLVRSLRRHRESVCVAGLGCVVAAGTFFVHGLLDYFFEFTPLFGLFWVTLGLSACFETPLPALQTHPSNTR
jgi:hypothetical protein